MSFTDYSKGIVKEYLGTVAYVDDLIFSEEKDSKAVKLESGNIREMVAKKYEREMITEPKVEGETAKREASKYQQSPNVNPSALTNAFLRKGIHCSLFEIKNDEDSLEPLKSILKKSDVVILDWQMHHDDGRKARELLLSVIKNSQQPELRLYVIFTNDKKQYKNLLSQTILPELRKEGVINEIPENIECVFKFGHSKIVVLEKENGEKSATTVSDEELPNRIIEEFTEITKGLVSNTALQAIIAIDRNIHRLLAVFSKKLDPAYLSHKSLLPNSSDSLDHITDLLGSEIKSIIKSNAVQEEDTIKSYFVEKYTDWTSDFIFENKESLNFEIPEKVTGEMLFKITTIGIENYFLGNDVTQDQKIFFSRNCHKNLTTFYTNDKAEADNANQEFAILTTLKSLNDKSEKILSQGTILKEDKKNPNYWLCIQPKCDSNRISTQSRDFLFLRLYKGSADRFDIVLFDGEKLIIDYKVYSSRLMSFKTNGENKILSFQENDYHKFLKQDNLKMIWIAELKNDFAQFIANNFAANLSRVGMDHSEWLRRS